MTPNLENVVYTVVPDDCPGVRFHSMPSACRGAADSLRDARTSYRTELIGRLGVGRRDLPPVIEHVEAVVHGMWVRERIGAVHRDHHADRMFLQALLADGAAQDAVRTHVQQATDAGADPVVVLMEPDAPVGAVFDQMTARDVVVVAYSDPDAVVGWAALYGESAAAPSAMSVTDIPRATPVGTLIAGQALRVPSDLLAVLAAAC